MIDDLIIAVIIININLLCNFFCCCVFSLSSFFLTKDQCRSQNKIYTIFSLVLVHFKAFTHFVVTREISHITCTHAFWRYLFASEIEVRDIFLKIACQVMKTEFHPWSMEAQEKESGDNQYNLGIRN